MQLPTPRHVLDPPAAWITGEGKNKRLQEVMSEGVAKSRDFCGRNLQFSGSHRSLN
ncbi:hypothetical protein ACFFQF_06090 [Haladaptatus pallidirubidus]|uniref:hypothetical protein n=1 Tax=Haladaptatus pallidirubidus TaxID=1008152 RepID=UPI001D0FC629|nr:hypothetical protein [Haladaptatus pallidirubidus]